MRNVDTEKLREMVGVVNQDPTLFQASIAENISFGSVGVVSQKAVEAAARSAHAHEFIVSLPQVCRECEGESCE